MKVNVKLNIKDIKDYKEEAIANYLKIMIDDFMLLLDTLNKLEEIDEDEGA